MMIGGLGIIRGQGSGGSQTKVAPFWMDPYPSEIGDEMSTIENEAWVEAVARALCKADGWTSRDVAHAWKAYRSLAIAAIRALAPLIIERCAEVAGKEATDFKLWKNLEASYGCSVVSDAIRALITRETGRSLPT